MTADSCFARRASSERGFVSFRLRCVMNRCCVKQDWQLNQTKRNRLRESPAILHSPSIQDSKRPAPRRAPLFCERFAAAIVLLKEKSAYVHEIKLR